MADSSDQSAATRQSRMADLALSASCAEPGEAADLLRELRALLIGAATTRTESISAGAEAARFEALLAADACASAVLLLMAGRAGYMVSQGLGGRVMATVTLGNGRGEVSSEGADLSLALIGALAEALSGPDQAERPAQRGPVSLRLN